MKIYGLEYWDKSINERVRLYEDANEYDFYILAFTEVLPKYDHFIEIWFYTPNILKNKWFKLEKIKNNNYYGKISCGEETKITLYLLNWIRVNFKFRVLKFLFLN